MELNQPYSLLYAINVVIMFNDSKRIYVAQDSANSNPAIALSVETYSSQLKTHLIYYNTMCNCMHDQYSAHLAN